MPLIKLVIYRQADLIYSFSYHVCKREHKLNYVLIDDLNDIATEAIFLAKVLRVNHNAKTAFIEYLPGKTGFINYNPILHMIQDGSVVVVQLVWHGDKVKQPKFRFHIQLVGKYAVRVPADVFSCVMKKPDADIYARINQAAATSGFTGKWQLRSVVNSSMDISLVIEEMERLSTIALATQPLLQSPYTQLAAGIPDYIKLLRSFELAKGCEVISNSQDIYQEVLALQDLWQIDAVSFDPAMNYADEVAAYAKQMDNLRVRLANGANLELANLNGIWLIDVNSDNANTLTTFNLNYSVVDEIYYQICLRNLQGIILIDFVKNMSIKEQGRLICYLEQCFRQDIGNTKVLGFSHSGLCEIIRNKY